MPSHGGTPFCGCAKKIRRLSLPWRVLRKAALGSYSIFIDFDDHAEVDIDGMAALERESVGIYRAEPLLSARDDGHCGVTACFQHRAAAHAAFACVAVMMAPEVRNRSKRPSFKSICVCIFPQPAKGVRETEAEQTAPWLSGVFDKQIKFDKMFFVELSICFAADRHGAGTGKCIPEEQFLSGQLRFSCHRSNPPFFFDLRSPALDSIFKWFGL
jgi:hypothetical protein